MSAKDTQPVYFDFNATTPLDPRVFEVMREWFLGPPANAGSRTHVYGHRAKDAVEDARTKVANVIAAKPEEIIFTSGATESNNIAILGLAAHGDATGRKHILSTTIEHKAVLEPLEFLATKGFEVELVSVGDGGYVETIDVVKRCRRDTLLVSIMHANNETGVIQPVKEIGEELQGTDILFHIDAAQTFGKEMVIANVNFDLLSISSHKIYGPQGIGALYVKRDGNQRMPISSIVHGGGQERGLRPGTIPVSLAVGFGEAARLATIEHNERSERLTEIKGDLLTALNRVEHRINGDLSRCQRHVINVRFPGIDSEALMMSLRDTIAISNGSACTSDLYAPSHVLLAMGLTEDEANESIRVSWGPSSSEIPANDLISAVDGLTLSF